jgi:hypothetical protein
MHDWVVVASAGLAAIFRNTEGVAASGSSFAGAPMTAIAVKRAARQAIMMGALRIEGL